MVAFAVVTVVAGFLYTRLPTSFVPDEDQGFILALVTLPSGATLQRTDRVMTELRDELLHGPRVSVSLETVKTSAWHS